MKQLLIIDPVHARGGMDHYCIALANEQAKMGYFVALATSAKVSELEVAEGVHILPFYGELFASRSKTSNLFWFLLGTLKTIGWTMMKRPLAIHIHLFQYTILELFLVAMAKLTWRPLVATVHDVESFRENTKSGAIQNAVFRLVDTLIVHNEVSLTELLRFLPQRRKDMRLIKHGNYINVVAQFNRNIGQPPEHQAGPLRILFFGQIKRVKGIEVLFDAAQILVGKGIDFTLNVKGKPSDYAAEDIETMLVERGIRDQTQLKLTYLPTGDVVTSMKENDVVVLPYRRIYQSGVLLFAVSAGAVVVSSNLPAMCEIIKDRQNGFTFADGSAEALAKVLEQIANLSPDQRNQISDRAFRTARDEFDWSDIAGATIEAYKRPLLRHKKAI